MALVESALEELLTRTTELVLTESFGGEIATPFAELVEVVACTVLGLPGAEDSATELLTMSC